MKACKSLFVRKPVSVGGYLDPEKLEMQRSVPLFIVGVFESLIWGIIPKCFMYFENVSKKSLTYVLYRFQTVRQVCIKSDTCPVVFVRFCCFYLQITP